MLKKLLLPALFALFMLPVLSQNVNHLEQKSLGSISSITPELDAGLSGSFIGTYSDKLIVAGGSNFAGLKPWEGGEKQLYDQILVATRAGGGLEWKQLSTTLPHPVTDGAAVSLPEGLLCAGGVTAEGLSQEVFVITSNGDDAQLKSMPKLPVPLKGHGMALIGRTVYVAGGDSPQGPSDKLWALDLNNLSAGWTNLPSMPHPLTGMILAAQMDGEEMALYAIGGRYKLPADSLTTFSARVWHFRPSSQTWNAKEPIELPGQNKPFPLAVAAGAAVGASHIVVAGGDPGTVYNRVEQAIHAIPREGKPAQARRDSLWLHHPGFNTQILVYNTITDRWFDAGQWEGESPVVTSMVRWGSDLIVVGGEIKPGIRTPQIKALTFSSKPLFGWINYLVLGLYFVGMLWLGFYFMKNEGSTDDFFKAGGRIPWWAAGISIFATTLSAITFIAIPAKAYATNWAMLIFNLCIILIAPVVVRYFLPFFRRFNLNTAYQYLELRFDSTIKWLASSLFILFMITRIAVVLYLPSLALNTVTGFNIYLSILLMGLVTIIYCTTGGIEAVVWGDVIQGIILLAGAILAFGFMLGGVEGGLSGFREIVSDHNKLHMFDMKFDFTQPVFWVVLLGGLANTLILYTSDQSVIQRYMTTKDEKATARSIWLNGIISVPVSIVFFLLGTGLFAFYTFNPDRLAVSNPNIDSVFPQFIVGELPAGLAGVLIAAIFAAAMSTLSSNINSVAAVFTSDFYLSIAKKVSEKRNLWVARVSSVVVGVLGIAMALVLATWSIASLWDQFNTFLGLLTSGLGALFLMGIFFRRISALAALIGLLGGLGLLLFVQQFTTLSFLLYGLIGLLSSLLIGYLASFIWPNTKEVKGLTYATLLKR